MDLIDRLNQISERIIKLKEQVQTEEATKNAFVMPFIQALGYDVFNPLEVVPEFVADLGTKKGEKVDYCILQENKPAILIECKHWKEKMDAHKSQLHRYFHVTNARLGVLTNGIVYQFYSDLVKKNVMDDKPFFEVSLDNISESNLNALKKFQKEGFDVDAIINSASILKFSKEIKELLSSELHNPTEEFAKYFAQRIYPGRVTSKVIEQFAELVQRSAKSFMNELIGEKLQIAIDSNTAEQIEDIVDEVPSNGIETTEEELLGFRIVQAILLSKIDEERISHRDMKSYFGILLDNNNRKPICRLHFNSKTKYIEVFDENREGNRFSIEKISDIYSYSDVLLKTVEAYDGSLV